MRTTLVAAAASLAMAAATIAAPASKPPPMAASFTGASDPAAVARDQILKDALAELKQAETGSSQGAYARSWQEMRWLMSGSGQVGRLYDLCTGAVEPPPRLSRRSWRWETLDPRRLPPGDRQKLVAWQAQQAIAQYGCGTVFVVGTLSADAHRTLQDCPSRGDGGLRDVNAFIAHVYRRPALRSSGDLTGVLVEALRADGCA